VKIGFTLPQAGKVAWQAFRVAGYAREVERLGADSLWVIDRLLSPVNPRIGHAGSDHFPEQFRAVLDPFVLLAVAATATERVLIGSNVINAPWYSPVALARTLTSLDVLSGGRLTPGFGVGWAPEEFEAMNVPMAERGSRLDETLEVLERLWTADPAEYHGKHWELPATYSSLKPVRRPPVYLAAHAPASMRRVARRADGWLPALVLPHAVDIRSAVNEPWAEIRGMAAEAGRDPDDIDVILRLYPTIRSDTVVEEVADLIDRVEAESEVRHVLVDLMYLADDVDRMLDVAARVLSKVRRSSG